LLKKHFLAAANQGDPEAQCQLACILEKKPLTKSQQQVQQLAKASSFKWVGYRKETYLFWDSAHRGNVQAMKKMIDYYIDGTVPPSSNHEVSEFLNAIIDSDPPNIEAYRELLEPYNHELLASSTHNLEKSSSKSDKESTEENVSSKIPIQTEADASMPYQLTSMLELDRMIDAYTPYFVSSFQVMHWGDDSRTLAEGKFFTEIQSLKHTNEICYYYALGKYYLHRGEYEKAQINFELSGNSNTHNTSALNTSFAYCSAGEQLLHGLEKEQDFNEAYNAFQEASLMGNKFADNTLGMMHFLGLVENANMLAAFEFFYISSRRGYKLAEYNLTVMHLHGLGTIKKFYLPSFTAFYSCSPALQYAKEVLRADVL